MFSFDHIVSFSNVLKKVLFFNLLNDQQATRMICNTNWDDLRFKLISKCNKPDIAMAILCPDVGELYDTCVLVTAVALIRHIIRNKKFDNAQVNANHDKYKY